MNRLDPATVLARYKNTGIAPSRSILTGYMDPKTGKQSIFREVKYYVECACGIGVMLETKDRDDVWVTTRRAGKILGLTESYTQGFAVGFDDLDNMYPLDCDINEFRAGFSDGRESARLAFEPGSLG